MTNLFRKAAFCTDIHFGLKSNSTTHLDDCEKFIDWFIATAKENGCETGFFLGDWHHSRSSINMQTLHYSLRCLEKLSKAFDRFFFICGNHDLYYRDKRDIHGVEWARHLPNIEIINDWHKEGDCIIAPWLVGDDHKKLSKMSARYMFGHFELPHFLMNARVEMPDHGEVKIENFQGVESMYSGHFHMRQQRGNINYIGNCFPHNFADAGDTARGMMIKSWGGADEYLAWPDQPLYQVMKLSEAIDRGGEIFKPNMHVRVELDIGISYEEANFIKETFVRDYGLREMALIPSKRTDIDTDLAPGAVSFQSVDSIVQQQLSDIESEFYDNKLLLKIYQNL